ncbi:YgcG family protein [Verrucomicrobium sp. 3C]|uniref:TPM domain-containing protein n=1 Tax=Verrucomicrobium sp. 3C TaxID=1134055 RepID=UPI00039B3010|nr:TPM domain-containing protein [Verrucomicrobium sp. 3C]
MAGGQSTFACFRVAGSARRTLWGLIAKRPPSPKPAAVPAGHPLRPASSARVARLLRLACFLLPTFWLAGNALCAQQEAEEPELAPIPAFGSYVVDQVRLLSRRERSSLERELGRFARQKGSQVAVLIVGSTRPESGESYGIRVLEKWKLGRKGLDDGILLLIVTGERTVRMEIGYGLEETISDAEAKRIIEERILPFFKTGQFFSGISIGIEAILAKISGEPLPPLQRHPEPKQAQTPHRIPSLAALLVLLLVIGSLFGPLLGPLLAAGTGAIAGWALFGSFWTSLLCAFLSSILTFLFAGSLSGKARSVLWRHGRESSRFRTRSVAGGARDGQEPPKGCGAASARW